MPQVSRREFLKCVLAAGGGYLEPEEAIRFDPRNPSQGIWIGTPEEL